MGRAFFLPDFMGKLSVFDLLLLVKYEGFYCIARL